MVMHTSFLLIALNEMYDFRLIKGFRRLTEWLGLNKFAREFYNFWKRSLITWVLSLTNCHLRLLTFYEDGVTCILYIKFVKAFFGWTCVNIIKNIVWNTIDTLKSHINWFYKSRLYRPQKTTKLYRVIGYLRHQVSFHIQSLIR